MRWDRLLGENLIVVVNAGDDFEHLGLHISPDLGTVLYTLLADPQRGWGLAEETWSFMDAPRELDAETWLQLGDRDLAMDVQGMERLKAGKTLSGFAARQFGITARILADIR